MLQESTWRLETYPQHMKIILRVKPLHSSHISLGIRSLITWIRNSGTIVGFFITLRNQLVKKSLETNIRDGKEAALLCSHSGTGWSAEHPGKASLTKRIHKRKHIRYSSPFPKWNLFFLYVGCETDALACAQPQAATALSNWWRWAKPALRNSCFA